MSDDLAIRLLAAIEERERWTWRKSSLRRCATDRRIVEDYLTEVRISREHNPTTTAGINRMWGDGRRSALKSVVVRLADSYGLVDADEVFKEMAGVTEEADHA